MPTSDGKIKKTADPIKPSISTVGSSRPLPNARLIIASESTNAGAQANFPIDENIPAISPPNAKQPHR